MFKKSLQANGMLWQDAILQGGNVAENLILNQPKPHRE
jgi:hypothetical protein